MAGTGKVAIRDGVSASAVLYKVLDEARARHPGVFSAADFPRTAKIFRKQYVEALPRFEAARIASPVRAQIAQELKRAIADELVFETAGESIPLATYLDDDATPLTLNRQVGGEAERWQFDFTYQGNSYQTPADIGKYLTDRNVINNAACSALEWVNQHALSDGRLDLSTRRIVVFGANAEMAPTRMLLEAGADVLWLDVAPPSPAILESASPGTLSWTEEPADLLTAPDRIRTTILHFADGKPVDLCLYAYAPGEARELRLTGAMNAIVDTLPEAIIRTVTMLVSPTTPTLLLPDDVKTMDKRKTDAPAWEKIIGNLGVMGSPGVAGRAGTAITRTLVSIQGASYQAAQYLGKVITAEHWSNLGVRVSANTAAITQTKSLDHPVFDAAFGGAAALQVETMTPLQSQTINGLLAVHDWLRPELPLPGEVRVHGGIHTLPYPLEKALVIAAIIGFCKSPKLLAGFFR